MATHHQVMDQDGKQRESTKKGLKGANFESIHTEKEVPAAELYGGKSHASSGKSEQLGPSLKCLYTNAHGMVSKQALKEG